MTLVFYLLNIVMYCFVLYWYSEGFQKFWFENTRKTAVQVMLKERFLEKRDF